jgi:hypothetical protein
MTDLAATDVAITLAARDRDIGAGALSRKLVFAQAVFGDGTKTYPVGGVPVPAMGNFNFVKVLSGVFIQAAVDGKIYKYDAARHTIRIFTLKDTTYTARQNSTAYSLGDLMIPATANGYLYRCSTAGTSAASPPTLGTTLGGTTTDGTAVWTCVGLVEELVGGVATPAQATLKMLMLGE